MTDLTLDPIEGGRPPVAPPPPPPVAPEPIAEPPAEAPAQPGRRVRLRRRVGGLLAGLSAIAIKELRGRMRGRRAFVNVTLFLLIIGGFAWMVALMGERSAQFALGSPNQSADIGRAVFGSLILLETFLIIILAPAFTSGAISLEREKQTIDLLVTTPISSVAIVLGKLISALVFIAVLIGTSLPFTAIVFVFGGVGPDDVLRGYTVLAVTAIGFSALGIFFSALFRRTQTATVVTYLAVLALTFGGLFTWTFWNSMTSGGLERFGPLSGRAPEFLLYPNPALAQVDVLCGTESGWGGSCSMIDSFSTGFAMAGGGEAVPMPAPRPGVWMDDGDGGMVFTEDGFQVIDISGAPMDVNRVPMDIMVEPGPVFAPTRDTFWPKVAATWLFASLLLVLAAIRLVSPTRRWPFGRPHRPSRPHLPRLRRRGT